MENYYINVMIVLRNKEFTLKKVIQKARTKEGRKVIGRYGNIKFTKVKTTIKNLPKTHDITTPEGVGNIIKDTVGNTGKVAGTFIPMPGCTLLGIGIDKKILRPVGEKVGNGVTTAMREAAPLYKYSIR
jgi:hypothetical protein